MEPWPHRSRRPGAPAAVRCPGRCTDASKTSEPCERHIPSRRTCDGGGGGGSSALCTPYAASGGGGGGHGSASMAPQLTAVTLAGAARAAASGACGCLRVSGARAAARSSSVALLRSARRSRSVIGVIVHADEPLKPAAVAEAAEALAGAYRLVLASAAASSARAAATIRLGIAQSAGSSAPSPPPAPSRLNSPCGSPML